MTDAAMLGAAQRTRSSVVAAAVIAVIFGILLATFIARGLTRSLRQIVAALKEGANQVNDAARQVSAASQQLAAGASEQASSLEQTSAALEEVAAMTRTNAESALSANGFATQARSAADEGDGRMKQLNAAMTGINDSSGKISRIIRVIEEIAFQTNLLALNAAVEAARAGEQGKGFAVVADEVRNLAQRAAQAARETTELIEGAVNNARQGAAEAGDVGGTLSRIITGVTRLSELIKGISEASEQQAQGVEQVNAGVSQIDKVTQQTASAAEECASSAEELAAQAGSLQAVVGDLVRLVGAARGSTSQDSAEASGRRSVIGEPL